MATELMHFIDQVSLWPNPFHKASSKKRDDICVALSLSVAVAHLPNSGQTWICINNKNSSWYRPCNDMKPGGGLIQFGIPPPDWNIPLSRPSSRKNQIVFRNKWKILQTNIEEQRSIKAMLEELGRHIFSSWLLNQDVSNNLDWGGGGRYTDRRTLWLNWPIGWLSESATELTFWQLAQPLPALDY